ncbi:MAG: FAD-binding domain-containing protein [Comamonadaceae bacterium]|nr:FAD-binding domain-containing protein [Comamonadaceae bacterium]
MRQLNQHRLHAQPAAHGGGQLPDQGPGHRLAAAARRYFARQLNDFDLAANNGGWQWAASTGCDAQPYFRIFNPVTQSEKFDAEGRFIRRYLPRAGAAAGQADPRAVAAWRGRAGARPAS